MKEIEQILVEFLDKWQKTTCKTSDVVEEFAPKILDAAKKEIAKNGKEIVVDDLDWGMYHYCLGCLGLTAKDKVRLFYIKED